MNASEDLSMIRTGTYFGESLIHSNETVIITPEKTSYALTSKVQDPQNPDITVEREATREDWDELQALVDPATFRTLPAILGQPDAADQGGEWVEITVGGEAKRIDLEMNASVPEIDALLQKLREKRNEISHK
jgi:hypothetical protein